MSGNVRKLLTIRSTAALLSRRDLLRRVVQIGGGIGSTVALLAAASCDRDERQAAATSAPPATSAPAPTAAAAAPAATAAPAAAQAPAATPKPISIDDLTPPSTTDPISLRILEDEHHADTFNAVRNQMCVSISSTPELTNKASVPDARPIPDRFKSDLYQIVLAELKLMVDVDPLIAPRVLTAKPPVQPKGGGGTDLPPWVFLYSSLANGSPWTALFFYELAPPVPPPPVTHDEGELRAAGFQTTGSEQIPDADVEALAVRLDRGKDQNERLKAIGYQGAEPHWFVNIGCCHTSGCPGGRPEPATSRAWQWELDQNNVPQLNGTSLDGLRQAQIAAAAANPVVVMVLDTMPEGLPDSLKQFPTNRLANDVLARATGGGTNKIVFDLALSLNSNQAIDVVDEQTLHPYTPDWHVPEHLPTVPPGLPAPVLPHQALAIRGQPGDPPVIVSPQPNDFDDYPTDDFLVDDHGLFVTGIIADIAPKAEIHLIRALGEFGVGTSQGVSYVLGQIAELRQAGGPQNMIVSLSLVANSHAPDPKLPVHDCLQKVIAHLAQQQVLIVASAGNDHMGDIARDMVHETRAPGRYDEVLSVAALTRDGRKAWYSNLATDGSKEKSMGIAVWGGDAQQRYRRTSSTTPTPTPTPVTSTGIAHATSEWMGAPFVDMSVPAGSVDAIAGLFVGAPPATTAGTPRDGETYSQSYPYVLPLNDPLNLANPSFPNPNPATRAYRQNDSGWVWWCGTSFATPIIAGVAAVLWNNEPTLRAPVDASGTVLPSSAITAGPTAVAHSNDSIVLRINQVAAKPGPPSPVLGFLHCEQTLLAKQV